MKNILVNVTDLQPGDTWLEHDGFVYVVYAVASESQWTTVLSTMQIAPNQTVRPVHALYGNSATLVVDRPNERTVVGG